VQAPTFSASNPKTVCASSATLYINPTCGATDYTYTISGNAGIVFTANGLQTLTTTNNYANVSFSGSPSTNTIKAKANYVGNHSSAEVMRTLFMELCNQVPLPFLWRMLQWVKYK
jgi:hypothetical protein